jgi:hypothetical protein
MMDIKSAISLPIALPVRINTFQMSLLVRDMPENNTYANVLIPESLIDGRTFLPNADPPTLLNLPVWRQFVHNAMFKKTVMLSVHGSTMQHLGALHSVITMDKDVPLQGMTAASSSSGGRTELTLCRSQQLRGLRNPRHHAPPPAARRRHQPHRQRNPPQPEPVHS